MWSSEGLFVHKGKLSVWVTGTQCTVCSTAKETLHQSWSQLQFVIDVCYVSNSLQITQSNSHWFVLFSVTRTQIFTPFCTNKLLYTCSPIVRYSTPLRATNSKQCIHTHVYVRLCFQAMYRVHVRVYFEAITPSISLYVHCSSISCLPLIFCIPRHPQATKQLSNCILVMFPIALLC